MKNNVLSLYIHIPFCWKLCPYCAFFKDFWSSEKESLFLDSIEKEIQFYSKTWSNLSVKTLYFGGGTPSILSPQALNQLFKLIRSSFKILPDCEISFEMSPESLTGERIDHCLSLGIDRLSLGVQSLNQQELEFLGRTHRAEQTYSFIKTLPGRGLKNFNLDLIFSLPKSTVSDVKNSVEKYVELGATHITTYGLMIEEGTPFFDQKIQNSGSDEEHLQYKFIRSFLKKSGYHHYEVSNFAKPGSKCNHNLNYWSFGDYIGLGPGAHSFFNMKRYQNKDDMTYYFQNPVQYPRKPDDLYERKTMLFKDYLIFNFRKRDWISISKINDLFGMKFELLYAEQLKKLASHKLLSLKKNSIRVTERGVDVLDSIMVEFL